MLLSNNKTQTGSHNELLLRFFLSDKIYTVKDPVLYNQDILNSYTGIRSELNQGLYMRYKRLGKHGPHISEIGLGTWQFGSSTYWGYASGDGRARWESVFFKALEVGINFIDTAELYGWGRSEELIGEFLNKSKYERDELVIASKYWPFRISTNCIFKAAENSRRRLGVDAIDLYQIHWPNPFAPIKNVMRNMEKLIKKGVIRNIGVSNFNPSLLHKAREHLSFSDIVSDQVHYNLIKRKPEKNGLLSLCQREGITVIAWSPLEQGLLLPGKKVRGIRRFRPSFWEINRNRLIPIYDAVGRIAHARGASPAQVLLAWLLAHESVTAIPGASSTEQVISNAAASEISLTEHEMEDLERAYKMWKHGKPAVSSSI